MISLSAIHARRRNTLAVLHLCFSPLVTHLGQQSGNNDMMVALSQSTPARCDPR